MKNKSILIGSLTFSLVLSASTLWACGGEDSGKHIGNVLKISNSTFTIRDAESNSPMTFNAKTDIINEVKSASGQIIVNYEKDEEGALHAIGVAF